ncbi:MerR family transcriptional regulator [Streptomyces sp. NBC_01304]|uniref:MerR family transcriptional regulator n=1 Tax=Streptomyces sp. NBC_01304 TaxID=2903818 RepID=UPI002E1382D9|nr:redoxin family protein [Streptomyces sp. NBC_01304]
MKIGELARRADTTAKAVRYYETLGLITPERQANGYRAYGEHDVRLVREIRALSALGIPVEGTQPFLECLAAGSAHGDDCPASLAGYRTAIDELTTRIEALTERRDTLTRQLKQAAYRNSGVPPHDKERPEMSETASSSLTQLPAGLPVPEDDGGAAHLPGLPAPRIALPGTAGDTVRLDALGAGRTVLYLYPLTGRPDTDLPEGWDAIPGARGCTTEACDFRDHHQELLDAGATGVFGLSSQGTGYQQELTARLRLPFAMLSDPELSLAATLDLPTFTAGGLPLYKRLTLIVRDGIVEHAFYPIFPPNEHARQVLSWLRSHPA